MQLSRIFDNYVRGLDEDFASSLKKWKKLFVGCVSSVAKLSKKEVEEVAQDLMLELVEEKIKYDTPQYTFDGHSYVITGDTLGAYVWISTPSWNKVYEDKRWILRECLKPIEKSSLDSYLYRQICQFKVDYLGKVFTKKNGYVVGVSGNTTKVKARSGSSGTFCKDVRRKVCKTNVRISSMSTPIGEDRFLEDILWDSKADAFSNTCLGQLWEVMVENMSKEALEYLVQTRILGEALTIPARRVKLFDREMDLVQRIYNGDDPLSRVSDGCAPVKFGMGKIN